MNRPGCSTGFYRDGTREIMIIHTTPEACILLKPMYFIEGVTGNLPVETRVRTGKSVSTILPLPLGWVRVLFRINGLGADFWAAPSPGLQMLLRAAPFTHLYPGL